MNPHYHPYGGPELTSPHPPSPDNNNYPGHPGPGGPHGHPHMHPSNGHGIGPLATTSAQNRSNLGHDQVEKWSRSGEFRIISQGHPGGPHDQLLHPHHQPHPAFSSAGPPPGAPHHPHNMNNNNNNIRICAGCGGKIVERFLLHALDRYWHNSCLKCSCCGAMLADLGTSCFTKSGMILCKNDYTRIFGGVCSACGQMIAANELVMRSGPSQQQPNAHVFHVKCFTCSKCSNNLVPGDRYYMLDRSLVCEQDWHKLVKSSAAATAPVRKGKVGRPRRSRD